MWPVKPELLSWLGQQKKALMLSPVYLDLCLLKYL